MAVLQDTGGLAGLGAASPLVRVKGRSASRRGRGVGTSTHYEGHEGGKCESLHCWFSLFGKLNITRPTRAYGACQQLPLAAISRQPGSLGETLILRTGFAAGLPCRED